MCLVNVVLNLELLWQVNDLEYWHELMIHLDHLLMIFSFSSLMLSWLVVWFCFHSILTFCCTIVMSRYDFVAFSSSFLCRSQSFAVLGLRNNWCNTMYIYRRTQNTISTSVWFNASRKLQTVSNNVTEVADRICSIFLVSNDVDAVSIVAWVYFKLSVLQRRFVYANVMCQQVHIY